MRWDHSLDARNINVSVSDGKVVLTGTVPAYPDRWEAEQDAYTVYGVSSVQNDLKVRPIILDAPTDEELKLRVDHILQWNHDINDPGIRVSVRHGVVTLSGMVDSYWQREKACDLASNIGGIVEIVNDLKVHTREPVADEVIRDGVMDALNRSMVDTSDVSVSVQDCTVILDGSVVSYDDYRTAEKTAEFTDGVCDIRNELLIQ